MKDVKTKKIIIWILIPILSISLFGTYYFYKTPSIIPPSEDNPNYEKPEIKNEDLFKSISSLEGEVTDLDFLYYTINTYLSKLERVKSDTSADIYFDVSEQGFHINFDINENNKHKYNFEYII